MALEWSTVCLLERKGFFKPGISVLDIGSSNVYNGEAAGIADFIRARLPSAPDTTDEFAADFAMRSRLTLDGQQQNKAFLGEILTAAGLVYDSIDIAEGYRTTLLDLNHDPLPPNFADAFDLVMNVGTSEHVLDQAAVFAKVHHATRPGGLMYHQLPASGFSNHGYFCYTPKLFLDLAGFNGYEILDLWFDGPSAHANLLGAVKAYRHLFPALDKMLSKDGQDERERAVESALIPDMSISVLFRRVSKLAFVGTLETSTSVGNIPSATFDVYSPVQEVEVQPEPELPPPPTLSQRARNAVDRRFPWIIKHSRRMIKRKP